MLTGLLQHVDKAKYLVRANSPAIMTGLGISGTVATAFLTGRASFKAADVIEQKRRMLRAEVRVNRMLREDGSSREVTDYTKDKIETEADEHIEKTLDFSTKAKLVWKYYIPAVAVGGTTITCIFMANRISSGRVAALTTAASISERALQEYREKVVEKLGERSDQKVRDEIAQDRIDKHPINPNEVILAGTGEVLCYDMLTGRYFQSSVEEIRKAENDMNFELMNHSMSVSLSEFHDQLGLPPTEYTESVGWNPTHKIKVHFSTTMSSDNRPCVAINFETPPYSDYYRSGLYG